MPLPQAFYSPYLTGSRFSFETVRRELGVCSRGPTITPSFLTVTSIHGQISPVASGHRDRRAIGHTL